MQTKKSISEDKPDLSYGVVGLVRIKALQSLLSVSRPTIYRWISSGYFPSPSKIGGVSVWRIDVVKAWIEEKAPWASMSQDK